MFVIALAVLLWVVSVFADNINLSFHQPNLFIQWFVTLQIRRFCNNNNPAGLTGIVPDNNKSRQIDWLKRRKRYGA